MAIERGRGARRFRTYLRKRRCYEEIGKEFKSRRALLRLRNYERCYFVNEGRKYIFGNRNHCCFDCGPGQGCDWYFEGIRGKQEALVASFDNELEEYGIFAPKSKPNRVWHDWKGRR